MVELPWLGSSPTPATAPLSPPAKPVACRTFTIRFASAARRCAGSLSPPLTLASADDRAKRNEMAKKSVKTSDLDANMADGERAEVCSTVTGGCSAKSGGWRRGGGWEERKEWQSAAQRAECCACDSSLRSKQRRLFCARFLGQFPRTTQLETLEMRTDNWNTQRRLIWSLGRRNGCKRKRGVRLSSEDVFWRRVVHQYLSHDFKSFALPMSN